MPEEWEEIKIRAVVTRQIKVERVEVRGAVDNKEDRAAKAEQLVEKVARPVERLGEQQAARPAAAEGVPDNRAEEVPHARAVQGPLRRGHRLCHARPREHLPVRGHR